jgi:hypothetical protein
MPRERDLNANVLLYGFDANDVRLLEGQSDVEALLEASLELAAPAE